MGPLRARAPWGDADYAIQHLQFRLGMFLLAEIALEHLFRSLLVINDPQENMNIIILIKFIRTCVFNIF